MSIKNKISLYLRRKRLILNLKHRNKPLLDRFRKTVLLTLFCILLWIINITLTNNLFESRTISISNSMAVSAAVAVSPVEDEGQVASDYSVQSSTNDIEALIRKTFGKDTDNMLKIAKCESGLNSDRIGDQHIAYTRNGTQYGTSHGIFQVRYLPGRPEPSKLHNSTFNIEYAKHILDTQGYYAWSYCYRHTVLNEI